MQLRGHSNSLTLLQAESMNVSFVSICEDYSNLKSS